MAKDKHKKQASQLEVSPATGAVLTVLMTVLALAFLFPVFIVLMNSFKGKLLSAAGYSLFITVCFVVVIVLFTSMTAWWITRVKNKFTSALYYLFVFDMIVPFQMVMFPMVKVANMLYLDNPVGIILLYLGFGSGLSVFMFSGFVKAIPVAILNAMWVWNDYLLPYLVLGTEYKTIPIAVQDLQGGYGSIDMGSMMAVLVLAIIPIVVFYMSCQKHIIKGVAAGAVKG